MGCDVGRRMQERMSVNTLRNPVPCNALCFCNRWLSHLHQQLPMHYRKARFNQLTIMWSKYAGLNSTTCTTTSPMSAGNGLLHIKTTLHISRPVQKLVRRLHATLATVAPIPRTSSPSSTSDRTRFMNAWLPPCVIMMS